MYARVDRAVRDRWVTLATDCVATEYPFAPGVVLRGPEDLRTPRQMHPAFGGSFDWHSSVHMHWSLVRMLRDGDGDLSASVAAAATARLAADLTPEHLAAEVGFVAAHPGFEQPYGAAWLLALHTEVARAVEMGPPEVAAIADAVLPELAELSRAMGTRLREGLRLLSHPVRTGTHHNTAFAALLALHHARATETRDESLEEAVVTHARRLFLHDVDAPTAYEPSGWDYLSPTLTEAHLMGEVLSTDQFGIWYEAFLPGTAGVVPPAIADPVAVVDLSDGFGAHLAGLTLSRAWLWRAIARRLPTRDERRSAALDAADRHLAVGLDHVATGSYAGDHWLVTFALLAVAGLDPAPAPWG
jgi:hypothetical protein